MTFMNGDTYPPRSEPIAIIGMGCRLPGSANSPESFWQLLRDLVWPAAISIIPN